MPSPPPLPRAAGHGAATGTRGRAPPALLTLQGSVQVRTRDTRLPPTQAGHRIAAGPAPSSSRTGRHRASRGAGAAAGAKAGPAGPRSPWDLPFATLSSGLAELPIASLPARTLVQTGPTHCPSSHGVAVTTHSPLRARQRTRARSTSQPGTRARHGDVDHHGGSHRISTQRQGSHAATGEPRGRCGWQGRAVRPTLRRESSRAQRETRVCQASSRLLASRFWSLPPGRPL